MGGTMMAAATMWVTPSTAPTIVNVANPDSGISSPEMSSDTPAASASAATTAVAIDVATPAP